MIEASHFGAMTVDGRTYTTDLFIYPDGRVEDNWWRRQGHVMAVDDILPLVDAAPELLVIGTGTSGRMRPEETVAPFLEERGIAFFAAPTAKAAEHFNQESGAGRKVGACFHLTC